MKVPKTALDSERLAFDGVMKVPKTALDSERLVWYNTSSTRHTISPGCFWRGHESAKKALDSERLAFDGVMKVPKTALDSERLVWYNTSSTRHTISPGCFWRGHESAKKALDSERLAFDGVMKVPKTALDSERLVWYNTSSTRHTIRPGCFWRGHESAKKSSRFWKACLIQYE